VDNYEAEGQGLTKTAEFVRFVRTLQADIINTLASTLELTKFPFHNSNFKKVKHKKNK